MSIIKHVGGESRIIDSPDDVDDISKFILPGVGAFDHGMQGLNNSGWTEKLHQLVLHENKTILGICLGMQLMCNSSDEGKLSGLGWIDAHVTRFSILDYPELRVPHMGWNTLHVKRGNDLLRQSEDEQRFYFVHSYHVVCKNMENVTSTAQYGFDITASFQHNNVYGVQFHPEKSHRFGKDFFKRFMSL
jgi:glutamine amidotransferase